MTMYPIDSASALHALNGNYPPVASSSNNGYSEHYPPPHSAGYSSSTGMRQQSQSAHPAQPPQNWMPPAHYSPQHPPSQQYNNPAWGNQMQMPPAYHSGMGMPAMNSLPFFPHQALQEAYALSQPVEPADEPILVRALIDSRSKGETYKDALNRLHGIRFHSSTVWKDYLLDNLDRIYAAVHAATAGPTKTAKKPSISALAEASLFSSSPVASSPAPSSSSRSRRQSQPVQPNRPHPSGRRTINSLTAPTYTYNERLPPPDSELKIPDPPSRSPSPPTEVIPHNRGGNKFTADDRAYFIKFILWRLKGDPTLRKAELCELLAEKAPHHNAASWSGYWGSHHALPTKILASMRADNEDSDGDGSEEENKKSKPVGRRKPKYRETSSESELTEETSEKDDDDDDDDDREDIEIPPFDESTMGQRGSPFTQGDLAITARHVASLPDFKNLSMHERWNEFSEKYPQRAAKSWNEYYRRNQDTINKLAKKIRKLNASQPPVVPQQQPKWTSPENGPPRAKRKFGEEGEEGGMKRPRPEGY
ncbi:hypothetical protein C8J57DRAFT_1269032 [Mycena rebaudengoi]|nr:hypothetical protein C8J57DRAFT_1269032 [Mycena rebaudengoi]